jgi:ubiquinone/menaquinone biosynthesis C-methylase UbiE
LLKERRYRISFYREKDLNLLYQEILILVGACLLAAGLYYFFSRPIRLVRDPGKEGAQDREASRDYDRMSRSPIFMVERRIVPNLVKKSLHSDTVLDVGSGPGYLIKGLRRVRPGTKIIGLDNNEYMLSLAKRNLGNMDNSYLVDGDVSNLPFTANSIDVVVSSLSLHHWARAQQAFNEIYRILKPGGLMIILDIRRNVPRFFYYFFVLVQFFSPKDIRRTNGAICSLWSGYTARELGNIYRQLPFSRMQIKQYPFWLIIKGQKREEY